MPERGRWLATIGAVAAAQALSWVLAPHAPMAPVVGAVLAFASVCASVVVVAWATPAFRLRALTWLVLPALVLGAVSSMGERAMGIGFAVAVAAALLAAGTLAGGAVGARIQHPSHLLVAAYASSVADLFSVLSPSGVSAQVVESEQLLALVAISWPIFGDGAIEPLLGFGDVVMCALYVVATRGLGLPVRRTIVALGAGFAAVLIGLLLAPVPLPALPLLGAAVVVAQPRTWRFRAGEGRTALLALALLTAVIGVAWALS